MTMKKQVLQPAYAIGRTGEIVRQQQWEMLNQWRQERGFSPDPASEPLTSLPSRQDFETTLAELCDDRAVAADAGKELISEVRDALELLERMPSLRSGEPDRYFTYEHPVLANALYAFRQGLRAGLTGGSLLRWIQTGIAAYLRRDDRDLVELAGLVPHRSIDLGLETKTAVRIAVFGDGGFVCEAQRRVSRLMHDRSGGEDYPLLIHLGDTYFSGSAGEMMQNLLAPLYEAPAKRRVTLLGNHDLYHGARPYMNVLKVLQQPGRYFAVDVAGWTIACLDTSLASPTVLRHQGLLDQGQLDWLEELASDVDGRRLVLMGHHPPISDWEDESEALLRQLRRSVIDKVSAWYWGHEHRCATYEPKGAAWAGAVVGNGAFQESFSKASSHAGRVKWEPKTRCTCYPRDWTPRWNQREDWPHGFVELAFEPGRLTELFILEEGETYERVIEP